MYGTVAAMEAMNKSALVIGGQGALGRAVIAELTAHGWTAHPAGRRRDERPRFRHLDLDRPETVAAALANTEVVISTVADRELTVEQWVLRHGGVLVNCSHSPGRSAAELRAEARSAGSVLLNAGLVPGLANLIAADLLRRHPEADCLEVAFTVLLRGTAGKAGAKFALDGLTARSRHRTLKLPLPEPFGELPFIAVGEGDDGGFSGVAGGRRVERYLGFADRAPRLGLRAVNALCLMRLLPRKAFALPATTNEVTAEPTSVWIGVRRGSERLANSVVSCDGDYRTTAAAARVFAELLSTERRPGCFNPEDLFSFGQLAPKLEEIGVRVGS